MKSFIFRALSSKGEEEDEEDVAKFKITIMGKMNKSKTSKQMSFNTYSKFPSKQKEKFAADAMFDQVISSSNSHRKSQLLTSDSEGPTKQTRAQCKRTQEVPGENGQLLSMINEKEGLSNTNESSTFTIFKENLKKRKEQDRSGARKLPQRAARQKRSNVKKGKGNEKGEKAVENFVGEMGHEPSRHVKKKSSKLAAMTKKVKAAKSSNSKDSGAEVVHPVGRKEDRNIVSKPLKDLNASVEIARHRVDSSDHYPSSLNQSSPEWFIREPKPKPSEEDSVLDGSDDSFSTDYEEISDKISRTEESSKYTYTYVSTYTQGTSCPSQSSTRSMNSLFVPIKPVYHLNSTAGHDKININEIEFPISPIHEAEITPMKSSGPSAGGVLRRGRNKYAPKAKERVCQPPKCSTMLFTSEAEITENLDFPVSRIPMESTDPSICSDAANLQCIKPINEVENCSPRNVIQTESAKNQRFSMDKVHSDGQSNHTNREVNGGVEMEEVNLVTNSEIKQKIDKANEGVQASKDCRKQTEKALWDGARKTRTDKTSNELMKKGISALRNIKRKASICVSGSGRESPYNNVEVHESPLKKSNSQIVNVMMKSVNSVHTTTNEREENCGTQEVHSYVQNSPLASSTPQPVPDSDFDDGVFMDVRKQLDEMGQRDLELCCVSRLCLRYRSLLMKKRNRTSNIVIL